MKNIDKSHAMAEALVVHETLDRDQINEIMAGRKLRSRGDDDKSH